MPQQTTQQYFKALTVLHFALITALVFFIVIAYFVQRTGVFTADKMLGDIFKYMVPALAFICMTAGNMLYKKRVNDIKKKSSLAEKLNAYRAAFILREAMLEGPALFAIIAYLLCGKLELLGVAVLLLVIFILIRPTKDKLTKELELSSDEAVMIEDDDAVISE